MGLNHCLGYWSPRVSRVGTQAFWSSESPGSYKCRDSWAQCLSKLIQQLGPGTWKSNFQKLPGCAGRNGKPLYERPAEEAERRPSGQVKHMSEEFLLLYGDHNHNNLLFDHPGWARIGFFKKFVSFGHMKHIEVSALIDAKKYTKDYLAPHPHKHSLGCGLSDNNSDSLR